MVKLDIGSGRAKYLDYITVDNDPSVGADFCIDVEDDIQHVKIFSYIGKVDEIRAFHILEHFKPENKVKVMALFWDLLKDGGVLDIEVPLFPHPASIQDPTHLSFWCQESFRYFIKNDVLGEAFSKRYSQYPVPLFDKEVEWWRGEVKPHWAYGIRLIKNKK